MTQRTITIPYTEFSSANGLNPEDKTLLDAAIKATEGSYAPYSRFHVGAAVKLGNGEIITAANQENAAYPSGLCAERAAIFYAHSRYPGTPVQAIAIAAKTDGQLTPSPTYPCGACRQVMIETQNRGKKPVRVIIGSAGKIEVIDSIEYLMPFAFDNLPASGK